MLKNIIEAITPSNISDIELLKDSMDIFFDYLMKNSNISIDIKNMFDQNKIPIYEEFVKIYLNAIYDILSKSEHNEALYSALKTNYEAVGLNINDINLNIDITKLLTEDYILTNKHYKEAKGTPTAMEYIYNIIIDSGVQNDFLKDNLGKFQFKEGKNIFEYSVEGTMIEAIYEHYVKPLTHPVGWAYFYQRIFYLAFTDYFDIKFVYTFAKNGLEVRCMNGNIYSKDNYLSNVSHDGKKLVQNNTVNFIDVEHIGTGASTTKRTTVYFESGETLVSDDNPRSLKLLLNNKVLINYNLYAGNCGLYINYALKIISTVMDSMNFCNISSIASTTGKMNVVGAGNVYIGGTICGDELVNKNVSVTYESYTGNQDGTDYANIFSAGGIDELKNRIGNYWDKKTLDWDGFKFDVASKTDILHNLSGKTAKDTYEMKQELQYCDVNPNTPTLPDGRANHLCKPSFIDEMKHNVKWDEFALHWDKFNYDGAYVSEDFEIDFDRNTWDTNLYFDNFQFDGKYIGGGFF